MAKTVRRAKKKEGFQKGGHSMNPDRPADKVSPAFFREDNVYWSYWLMCSFSFNFLGGFNLF